MQLLGVLRDEGSVAKGMAWFSFCSFHQPSRVVCTQGGGQRGPTAQHNPEAQAPGYPTSPGTTNTRPTHSTKPDAGPPPRAPTHLRQLGRERRVCRRGTSGSRMETSTTLTTSMSGWQT